ncbi:transient receptor potential cation channel subfamily A member 1 isoform X3 [Nematostella vectensis]|uniref:transient receptor potential cation channel subfamily A member 1 isoform X3 n=1 Tax=Nematostella vectensis TaxID=45351 RepID=UPI0020772C67|nr:transient receptor potential cation channel subfamily A member 1 isoform X3 [Nematostella vectensis]
MTSFKALANGVFSLTSVRADAQRRNKLFARNGRERSIEVNELAETDSDGSGGSKTTRFAYDNPDPNSRISTPELFRHAISVVNIKTRINLRFNREHHGCLHRAVLNGNEEEVESFLSAGKDINAHDEYGKTPLHCAVGAQKLNIVLCLLSYRPDIDAHDDRDDTPLHTAVRTGNIDIVKALLKEGHADSNKVGNAGCTPLHVAAQLEHANNVTICQILLDHNAKLLSRDHKYMTPIAHAALHGSYDVMISLFHHAKCQGIPKDDLLFEVDGVGSTLLHLAVESGSARVVELCLDEGAAPHSVKSQDGSTPVHLACSYGYMDILDILMKAVAFILDPPPDQDGMLPIHRAAQSNHHEVIAYLLKQDTDQVDAIDHLGRTPIMLAAENGCFESVRVLLDHNANVDIRDSENKTVLHYAIGVAEILKEILKDVKANSLIRAKDRLGNTPLHYAARHGCVKDVSIILMKYKASAAIVNGIGEIPLHIGARNGWIAVVKKLTEGRGKRTMNANDANERTPLHLAAREGHDELVEFFLKRGARIDRDVQGQTPLHYAARQGSKKALELILENKPDCLNVTDKNQNTAIHMAALGGHAEILEFLLSKPEQVVSVNERNQNILDIAIEERHENVAMKIAENKRWKEVVRSTVHGTYTQIQLLVRHMPAVAKKFLDRCVETEGDPEKEDYKVSYDLKFIQGMPDERKKTKYIRESLIALHTMVKYERLECLTHPLCSVLMDIKWRKFGLVCAFLNQAVYLIYISLIMVIMQYIVSFTKHNMENVASNTTIKEDPLIVKSFRDDPLIAAVAVVLIIACVYNLAKEFFQMFDEGWNYFFSINNWMEVTLYVMTFVTIVRPRGTDLAELAVCVFLAWIVLLHYISKFNYVGLYIVMIRKTVMTVFKVLIILLIFLAAFAFSFHVITVPLTNVEVAKTRFSNLSASLAATFFMILDNLRYDEIVLNYSVNSTGTSTGSAIVLNILFISYCFMMPIIFLNLLIGLAVGDIDNIRKTAAMERYTSQVEHLSQLERALPTFILSKVQVTEYVEHPNRKKNFKDKIVNLLVMLLSPRQEQDKKLEHQTNMEERVQRHEAELRDISAILRKHSVLLEELRDLLQDRKIRGTVSGEGVETGPTNSPDTNSEFFV